MKGVMITDKRRNIVKKMLLVILSLCVFVIGCDDMSKPAMDVISEAVVPPSNRTPDIESSIEEYPMLTEVAPDTPEITFENVLNLSLGRYRLRPLTFSMISDEFGDSVIHRLYMGNIDSFTGDPYHPDGIAENVPKISSYIELDPKPYSHTLDRKPVIELDPSFSEFARDEIVVEIYFKGDERIKDGGTRGNKYKYTEVIYRGIAIENLTNPHLKFEYDVDPISPIVEKTPDTEPEIPELTFENVLDVEVGERYRLIPTAFSTDINRDHLFITTVYWGNVDINEMFIENGNFPADARKIRLFLAFDPPIYTYTPEGEIVIGYDGTLQQLDEIVIEVTSKPNILQRVGELMNQPVTYLSVGFLCKPIENLTQPDRNFKYDEE